MIKYRKVTAAILCVCMLMSQSLTAYAETGHSGNVAVNISAEAIIVDITVPSSMDIVFNSDGTTTMPTNYEMVNNNKIASVYLASVTTDASDSGWKFAGENYVFENNEKTISFYVGKEAQEKVLNPESLDKNTSASVFFESQEIVLEPETPQLLSFDIKRAVFTEKLDSQKAFDMQLEFRLM